MVEEEVHDHLAPDEGVLVLAGKAEQLVLQDRLVVVAAGEAVAVEDRHRREVVVLDELEWGFAL